MTPGCLTSNKSLKIIVVHTLEEMCMALFFRNLQPLQEENKLKEVEINLRPGLELEGNGPVERAGYCIGKTGIRVGVLMVFDLLNMLLDTRVD